jgi:REP element-mobilizing transposase RayT
MARPLRIEFAGALYHVTSRGDGREDIYLGDGDKVVFLEVLSSVCEQFNWVCHAYCLMSNHYHLLIETPDGNLSQGMRQLNGVYTQRFNREHGRVGHVFQGRYKAILVEKDSYLLELARYIVLNPVRAGLVRSAKDWPWSSYRATSGQLQPPDWLTVEGILSAFGVRKTKATEGYKQFIAEGKNQPSPWTLLKNQIYLGSDKFVQRLQQRVEAGKDLREIPSPQRRPIAKPLSVYEEKASDRDTAIFLAYHSGGYSMKEIGDYFGLHYSRVSQIITKSLLKT